MWQNAEMLPNWVRLGVAAFWAIVLGSAAHLVTRWAEFPDGEAILVSVGVGAGAAAYVTYFAGK
jgi:hypothetical protein